jgi:cytochrome b pre-mRNA-processing protein 3
MLKWLMGPSDLDRKAQKLYGAVVAAARRPAFYAGLGVPDTPEGRFELVALHLYLLMDRLCAGGEDVNPLIQRTIETFITDMDDCMREFGVGDITVAKKVKRAAAVFYDRSGTYRAALDATDDVALAAAVQSAINAPAAAPVDAETLARYIRSARKALQNAPLGTVEAADAAFPSIPEKA